MSREIYASGFNIVQKLVDEVKARRGLVNNSSAFYFVSMRYFLGIGEDAIADSITDRQYLSETHQSSGEDQGIDAVYIDEPHNSVYLFNYKYRQVFKESDNFDLGECNKIATYIDILKDFDATKSYTINTKLFEKTKQIAELMQQENISIHVVFASNCANGLPTANLDQFKAQLKSKIDNIEVEEFHITALLTEYLNSERAVYDGRCRLQKENLFPNLTNTKGNLFVLKLRGTELLKLFVDNEKIRTKNEDATCEEIVSCKINEELFEDNVRLYLSKTNQINDKIVTTAKDSPAEFFFYNNGITIVCDECKITGTSLAQMTLKNYQAVNGGQTIHSLLEAGRANRECLKTVEVLCRIFAGADAQRKSNIARYTNSQTKVTDRDLSSLDYVQKLLDKEFRLNGLYYERKVDQYKGKPKKLRYDSSYVAQRILAYDLENPHVARSGTRRIFTDKFVDDIFSSSISADKIIKLCALESWLTEVDEAKKAYLKNSRLYVLCFFRLVFDQYKSDQSDALDIDFKHPDPFAIKCKEATYHTLITIVEAERVAEIAADGEYSDTNYFKKEKPVTDFKNVLNSHATLDGLLSATDPAVETPEAEEE